MEKMISCMTPSFLAPSHLLCPSTPMCSAHHCCQSSAKLDADTALAKGINRQLGLETLVTTALQHNDKICRAMWKRRTCSLSFVLCAIERHVNKHVHFHGFYCNNNFLAPLDFFIVFLRVIILI